jgi:putative Holliday junction resolvase
VLDSQSRIVGVDYGTKRVGLALADPLRTFAQAHGAFTPDAAIEELERIRDEDDIEVIVVGWPLTLAGEEGDATEQVQQYIDRLQAKLPDARVVRRDERYTSEMAKDALREAGVRQPGRNDKGRVDAAAAALILQDYLDAPGQYEAAAGEPSSEEPGAEDGEA